MTRKSLAFAFFLAATAVWGAFSRVDAADTPSWEDAVPVSIAGSRVTVLTVRSTWASDYDYGLRRQGPIYFNDCAQWVNDNSIDAVHVQLMFALVNAGGVLKSAVLPLDVRTDAKPGVIQNGANSCRDHAYANGTQHFWLVAWINRVDFADGTSWTAPTGDALTAAIRASLSAD